jgi:hypothetical protein
MNPEALKQVYLVQELDTQISQLRYRLNHLDRGEREQAERDQAQDDFHRAQQRQKQLHIELTDRELELKSVEDKKKKFETRLFAGTILNPKELDATRKEVEALARQREHLDERILNLWDEIEAAKQATEKAEKKLNATQTLCTKKLAEYQRQKDELQRTLHALQRKRDEAAAVVHPDLLQRYERSRKKHNGVGIAKVYDGTCEACGMTLPVSTIEALRDGSQLATCDACARLLCIE